MGYDVVVAGGGAAGIAAAIGAAQTGGRVCLVEKHGFLGGAATASSVLTYCGFFARNGEQVVQGVGQGLLDRLKFENQYQVQRVTSTGNTIVLLDQETLKRVLDEMVLESGVDLLLHATVTECHTTNNRIDFVTISHRGGTETILGTSFVDASGDGVLIREACAGEILTAVGERQASTLVMRIGGVHDVPAEVDSETIRQALDRYLAETDVTLPRRDGINVTLPVTGDRMVLMADSRGDVLDVRALTKAETSTRQLAWHYLRAFQRYLPGWERAYLTQTGPNLGIREARRLQGQRVLTGTEVEHGAKGDAESVGRGGWPIENHSKPGGPKYSYVSGNSYFEIPYGCTVSSTHANLWAAGRLLSTDAEAFASVRVMGTSFATGHAAGVAAALAARSAEETVTAEDVRSELTRQGALL